MHHFNEWHFVLLSLSNQAKQQKYDNHQENQPNLSAGS